MVCGLVSRSLNLAKVAKEIVTETYQSNGSVSEYVEDIKQKLMRLDQVYLDAAKKVTQDKEENIKESVEYKLLNFGAQQIVYAQANLAKVSEVRKSVTEGVIQKRQVVKAQLDSYKDKLTTSLRTNLQLPKETHHHGATSQFN